MFKFLTRIFNAIFNWMFAEAKDSYLVIKPAPVQAEVTGEIPARLLADDVPNFGVDQDRMLRISMERFTDDVLRVKWLKAMHDLRFKTKLGWIAEAGANEKNDNRYTTSPIVKRSEAPTTPDDMIKFMKELDLALGWPDPEAMPPKEVMFGGKLTLVK